jgi:hypothetical protein
MKVQFSGGLGNQLFTYAAFKHFANLYDQELTIDCSVVERVLERDADILSFRLGGENIVRDSDVNLFADYLNRVSWRNRLTRKVFKRKLYPNINDEFNHESSLRAWNNRGFFQTSEYFSLIGSTEIHSWFDLKNESEEFKKLRSEILEVKPYALHVRRGDYRNFQKSFGLLETSYFTSSVDQLRKLYGERPIWVFSDEPESVAKEFSASNLKLSRFILPSELNASETLKLMSLAHAQVISNSTFSWWAGALSESQRVVYPEPWFKTNEGWLRNDELALPNWIAQKASWSE